MPNIAKIANGPLASIWHKLGGIHSCPIHILCCPHQQCPEYSKINSADSQVNFPIFTFVVDNFVAAFLVPFVVPPQPPQIVAAAAGPEIPFSCASPATSAAVGPMRSNGSPMNWPWSNQRWKFHHRRMVRRWTARSTNFPHHTWKRKIIENYLYQHLYVYFMKNAKINKMRMKLPHPMDMAWCGTFVPPPPQLAPYEYVMVWFCVVPSPLVRQHFWMDGLVCVQFPHFPSPLL
jgi:hypothetical protein